MKSSFENNMENLPAEVLEIVFRPFSTKEDIEKCFNTNSKWRHIIENMVANKSKYISELLDHDQQNWDLKSELDYPSRSLWNFEKKFPYPVSQAPV